MLNKCSFIGRVGKEADIRYTGDNKPIASLSLGVTKTWKDKQGNKQEKTEWIPVTFFGKVVEVIQNYVSKGDLLYVEGEWQTDSYDKNGEKRYSTKLIGKELKMLGGNKNATSQVSQEETFDPSSEEIPFD